MQTRHKLLGSAILLACGVLSTPAQAVLSPRAILNFTPGVCAGYCSETGATSGSYFGMDTNGNSKVLLDEKTPISQHNGLIISTTQAASGAHAGNPGFGPDPDLGGPLLPQPLDPNPEDPGIDAAWGFFGNTGLHFTATAINVLASSGNTATVDFSGWRVTWSGIATINMGTNAWITAGSTTETFVNGVAQITCSVDCTVGNTYSLDYHATVPAGDPSGFGGVRYSVHLEGTIGTYNVAPVASNSNSAGVASTTFPINLLPNITDANNNIDVTTVVITTQPACGTMIDNNDGTVTFPSCADGNYTFIYTIADTDGAVSTPATVAVNVALNPPPNTTADPGSTNGITPVTVNVGGNDTDNGTVDLASVVVFSQPAHGAAAVAAVPTDGITYTATAGFSGIDTFRYTIEDTLNQVSADTLVTVTVNAMNVPSSSNSIAPGTVAVAASSTNGIITFANIGIADNGSNAVQGIAQSCIGGCFDFIVSGLTNGATAQIVLPLSTAIPAPAANGNTLRYRKIISGSWFQFDETNGNSLASTAGTVAGSNIICPPASDISYADGLNTGDRCVRLSIVDGGVNDADGLANGTVVDPGGIAETTQRDTRVSGTEGCSMTGNTSNASDHADWLLLAGFMAMLGWFGMKRRRV